LAVTRPGTPVRVGAWGATEDEAAARFNDAYRWLERLVTK
jgi:hypothetical protein